MKTYNNFDFSCYRSRNGYECDVYFNNGSIRMDATLRFDNTVNDIEIFDEYEDSDSAMEQLYDKFQDYMYDIVTDLMNGAASTDYEYQEERGSVYGKYVTAENKRARFKFSFHTNSFDDPEKLLPGEVNNFNIDRI